MTDKKTPQITAEQLEYLGRVVAGDVLRSQKQRAGLNQRDIGGKMGVSANFLSLLEQGRAAIPIERLVELVRAYEGDKMLLPFLVYAARRDCYELFIEMIKSLPEDLNLRDSESVEKAIGKWRIDNYGFG